jgi:hypothetical protein
VVVGRHDELAAWSELVLKAVKEVDFVLGSLFFRPRRKKRTKRTKRKRKNKKVLKRRKYPIPPSRNWPGRTMISSQLVEFCFLFLMRGGKRRGGRRKRG